MTVIALLLSMVLQTSGDRTEFVSFCDVLQHPDKYDQKSVLTTGIYQAGPEFSDFVEPDCPTTSDRDYTTLPVPVSNQVQRTNGWRGLRQELEKNKKAFVVIRAVFDAYNRYEGPLPADPKLQEVLKLGNSRFGHLNFARYRLRIESVEFVGAVSK